jgi:hypothetical protein
VDASNVTIPPEKSWITILAMMIPVARNLPRHIHAFENGANIILIPSMEKHGVVPLELRNW